MHQRLYDRESNATLVQLGNTQRVNCSATSLNLLILVSAGKSPSPVSVTTKILHPLLGLKFIFPQDHHGAQTKKTLQNKFLVQDNIWDDWVIINQWARYHRGGCALHRTAKLFSFLSSSKQEAKGSQSI